MAVGLYDLELELFCQLVDSMIFGLFNDDRTPKQWDISTHNLCAACRAGHSVVQSWKAFFHSGPQIRLTSADTEAVFVLTRRCRESARRPPRTDDCPTYSVFVSVQLRLQATLHVFTRWVYRRRCCIEAVSSCPRCKKSMGVAKAETRPPILKNFFQTLVGCFYAQCSPTLACWRLKGWRVRLGWTCGLP